MYKVLFLLSHSHAAILFCSCFLFVQVASIQHANNHCPPAPTFQVLLSKLLPENFLYAVTNTCSQQSDLTEIA